MYITIDEDDLKRVKLKINSTEKINRIKKFQKDFFIYSIIMIVIILSIYHLYLKINNIPALSEEFSILNMVAIVSFGFFPVLICINKLKNENFEGSRYKYLFDQFFINVNSEQKELILISKKTNIKINLIKENIEMYNDTLLLYHNKNLVAIIPLYKLINSKYLLEEIEKNVEVNKYEN